MTLGSGNSTAGSVSELSFIVQQLGSAKRVEGCVEALQSCFDHFQLADYILLPSRPQLLPMVTSKNSVAIATGRRLEAQQQSGEALFSLRSVPQFPFKVSDLADLDALKNAAPTADDHEPTLELDDTYVLPVRGDEEKAYLFIWDSGNAVPEDKMLALQAICANSIKRIEELHRQQEDDGAQTPLSSPSPLSPLSPLSQIELSLLKGLASGRRQDEIAQDYGLSPHTISLFSNQIAKKLGARSIRQAISLTGKTTAH